MEYHLCCGCTTAMHNRLYYCFCPAWIGWHWKLQSKGMSKLSTRSRQWSFVGKNGMILEMDTAILRGVGSGRVSSAPFRVLYRSRVLVVFGPDLEASLAPSPTGVRTLRGTAGSRGNHGPGGGRTRREPLPPSPAGLQPNTCVTRPGDPLRVPRMAWGMPVHKTCPSPGRPEHAAQKAAPPLEQAA
jgi:hypothetical protein